MGDDWQDALTPFAREVIASAEDDVCDDGTFERMNKKVLAAAVVAAGTGAASAASAASVGSGAVGSGAAGSGAAAATASLAAKAGVPTLGAVFFKVLAAVVIGSSVVGGALWTTRTQEESPAPVSASPVVATEGELRSPSEVSPPVPEEPASDEEMTEPNLGGSARAQDEGTASPPRRTNEVRSVDDEEPRSANVEQAPTASLGDELRLLRELQRSVQTRPAHAVRLADEHEVRFGRSELGPERELHRVRALIELDRSEEASRFRDRFHATFPASPYGPRVDALLEAIER
jgi:hypothetical protein